MRRRSFYDFGRLSDSQPAHRLLLNPPCSDQVRDLLRLSGLIQPLPTGRSSGSLGLRFIALQAFRSKGGNGWPSLLRGLTSQACSISAIPCSVVCSSEPNQTSPIWTPPQGQETD